MKSASKMLVLTGLILAFVGGAVAQDKTGRINGVVTDEMGAVVGRAKIVVTTGETFKSLQTDEMGEFSVVVPIGLSRVTVQSPGFEIAKLNRIRVTSRTPRSLKIVLKVREVKYGPCDQPICIWL